MAIAAVQLTILNSVVAVTMLSHELFPDVQVTMAHMSVSVGVMNAVGPWFGVMPCCHGAGGLAAQVRFGARSGAAPMVLGVAKLAAGLLLGSSLFELLRHFPEPLLGCMLVLSGVELASTASKLPQDKAQWCVLLLLNAVLEAPVLWHLSILAFWLFILISRHAEYTPKHLPCCCPFYRFFKRRRRSRLSP